MYLFNQISNFLLHKLVLQCCTDPQTTLLPMASVRQQTGKFEILNNSCDQTWGDYSTNVIDYNYLPPARLRLNKIPM